jgi:omega-6 fatty acid desaturase (delta-12 desaturase)
MPAHPPIDKSIWRPAIAKYSTADPRQAAWQLLNSFIPYIALWVLMALSLNVSYWLTLLLSIPAAGFLVRIFIIHHDCGHGSFLSSAKANDFWGILTGLAVFTPYYEWRRSHAIHHATAGDLDRRGVGDVLTLTLKEYRALPPLKRLGYWLYRFPPITFILGPVYSFLIANRFPAKDSGRRERWGVWWTNLALLGLVALLSWLLGLRTGSWLLGLRDYALIQLPVIILGGGTGVWMFYVQHNFPTTLWARHEEWDFAVAAVYGSSYYQLPRLLQWFTGNIGFHHIHHLGPKVANYNLERCYRANPVFQTVKPLTLRASLHCLALRVWDEDQQKMVGF